jgi:hypothetical protein
MRCEAKVKHLFGQGQPTFTFFSFFVSCFLFCSSFVVGSLLLAAITTTTTTT